MSHRFNHADVDTKRTSHHILAISRYRRGNDLNARILLVHFNKGISYDLDGLTLIGLVLGEDD